jgi:hypothetical protein
MKKLSEISVCLVVTLFIVFTALPAVAEDRTVSIIAPQSNQEDAPPKSIEPFWGTASTSVKQVNALTCMPLDSATTYSFTYQGGTQRYCPSGYCAFACNVDIPSGAKILYIEIDGCDSSATGHIMANLAADSYGSGSTIVYYGPDSGPANSPGCTYWRNYPTFPWTVDNDSNSYYVEVSLSENSTETTFSAIRIGYQLQVSPAPTTATFIDVSTSHPLFQYIEALAASGITTGYDDDTFRPSQPITRGQMAVFLSRALGLHWPD